MGQFKFDEGAIKKLAHEAVRETAKEAQKMFDSLGSPEGETHLAGQEPPAVGGQP